MNTELLKKIYSKVKLNWHKFDVSLFQGKSGYSVFLVYLIKFCDNKNDRFTGYLEELNNVNDDIIKKCLTSEISEILIQGRPGLLANFTQLYKFGLIELEDYKILSSKLQVRIPSFIEECYSSKNYDLFYGITGSLIPLLQTNIFDKSTISAVIDQLSIQCKDIDGNYSYTFFKNNNRNNLTGLGHGFCMLISFCLKCYENDIDKEKSKEIILGLIDSLCKVKNKDLSSNYCFPLEFNEINDLELIYINRLAWCHGDLGIALTLARTGIILQNNDIYQLGLETALKCCNRDIGESYLSKYENTEIYDIGLCHGLSSIAHLFFRLYFYTKNEKIKEKYIYWKNLLIENTEMVLKNFDTIEKSLDSGDEYSNEIYSMLNGIIGVGLVIASHEIKEDFSWDEVMLLS